MLLITAVMSIERKTPSPKRKGVMLQVAWWRNSVSNTLEKSAQERATENGKVSTPHPILCGRF